MNENVKTTASALIVEPKITNQESYTNLMTVYVKGYTHYEHLTKSLAIISTEKLTLNESEKKKLIDLHKEFSNSGLKDFSIDTEGQQLVKIRLGVK